MNTHFQIVRIQGSRFLIGSLLLLSVCFAQFTFPGKANPHGADNCAACHTDASNPSKLNYDKQACTSCHDRQAVNSRIHQLDNLDLHGSGITLPADFVTEKADQFSCLTCHAVVCKTDRANQTFLRGGPYQTELDFCYVCHSNESYQALNPHKQIRKNGAVDESTCQHCHVEVPSRTEANPSSSQLHLEMTPTCNKCHALHHHETMHVDKVLGNQKDVLKKTEAKYGISFPLSVNEKIQCNTCHYTHQKGVLPKENVVFENTGDNQWRLRLEKERLCFACHDL